MDTVHHTDGSVGPRPITFRTIRWKMQLGLLKDVSGMYGDASNQMRPADYLETLAKTNETLVIEQRNKYEQLAAAHFRQSSALAIIGDTENRKNTSPLDQRKQTYPLTPMGTSPGPSTRAVTTKTQKKIEAKVVVDDPLSLMASIEEEKIQVEKEKEMQQKKERAMANRPHLMHHPAAANISNQKNSEQNFDANQKINGTGGSIDTRTSWDAFYSGKEIMDIIDKDLDRLPIDHHIYFHQRKTNRIFSINDTEWNAEGPIAMQSRGERSKLLSEILFVYAKENPLGYRQGMHEILSFLMMAIEKDLLQRDHFADSSGTSSNIQNVLLNSTTIIHDTYTIFNAVMEGLSPAFESRDEGTQNSMEKMGLSTMNVISEWHGDDELVEFISNLGVPPELYCTRWIRLMFSREVVGMDNVFKIWDEFFQQYSESSGKLSMMRVLETTAAAFIIMIEDKLIPSSPMIGEFDDSETDEHEAIHLLMNYPRIQDTSNLIETVLRLIRNQISGEKPAKIKRVVDNQYQPHDIRPATQMNEFNPLQTQTHQQPPQHPGMYDPNQQFQGINDTIYYTHQGLDPNAMMNPMQPNIIHHEQQHQQHQQRSQRDTLRSTLKTIKSAPTWNKVSSGFNVALKTAIDTVQSIDTSLQNINISGVTGSGNTAAPSNNVVHQHHHHMNSPGNFNAQPHNELFLGYRDTQSIPSFHDGHHSNHISLHEQSHAQDHVETEDSFVGDRNLQNNVVHHHTEIPPPSNHNVHSVGTVPGTGMQPDTSFDLSLQLASRIDASVKSIALHLQGIPPGSSGYGKDVWYALSELEAIRDELISKYEVSHK